MTNVNTWYMIKRPSVKTQESKRDPAFHAHLQLWELRGSSFAYRTICFSSLSWMYRLARTWWGYDHHLLHYGTVLVVCVHSLSLLLATPLCTGNFQKGNLPWPALEMPSYVDICSLTLVSTTNPKRNRDRIYPYKDILELFEEHLIE